MSGGSGASSHLYWVACNRCCRGPTSSLRFVLTSCQHIYCSQCCTTATQPGCFVCAAQQPRLFSIGADLPKEARPFFSNQVDLPIVQLGRVGDFKDSQVKILLQNLGRMVMDFRKRVDESGRQLNLKREEVAQAERALNERETSVQRLQSAMASFGGRGGAEFNPRTSGSQPVNFFNSGSNQAEPVSIFSSQQPVLGGRDHIWAGVSSSQGGARRGVGGPDFSGPLF